MFNYLNNKNFRIFVLAVLDTLIVVFSSIAALALRFDGFEIPERFLHGAVESMPFYFISTIVIMYFFKLYNRVWTYASLNELYAVIKASCMDEIFFICFHVFFNIHMPRSYYPIQFVFMTILFLAVRFAKKILKYIQTSNASGIVSHFVMVVGAGSAASILIRDLQNTVSNSKAVCVIDDNINKKNKYLIGVPIVGGRDEIIRNTKKYNVTDIIIAMPSAPASEIKKIISICQKTGKPVKILPSVTGSLSCSIIDKVRPINYEDFLGRDPIIVNHEGIGDFIKNKIVLVTGGGGSIGSELCRQIIKYSPKKLIIFDIYENNAYEIQMELTRHYPHSNFSTLIGSVRDYGRLDSIFKKYRPDIVYHAAAHKHVPLMEKSPNEALKNNCMGTLNMVKLADKYQISNFILISTDKAVKPTSLMGATKRICEMIVQTYARKSQYTKFAAVRFGNVLGSNGSVIPLFLKQIEEGGPVTVTDKEIKRFFMTIPEAVSLVLQASLFAKGGEIFVLDMGNPIKIYELAEELIKMKGFRPGIDIPIEVVGLRPGEKLYEEILLDEEGLDKTENDMIFIGKPLKFDENNFLIKLNALIEASKKNGHEIKEMTKEVCSTYTITDN